MTKSTSQKRKQNLPAPAELPAESPGSPLADASKAFPIVGIGSSAGGLEALEQFLSAVPADCGMAFVIVQHLDPTQKGYLTELIKRATRLAVTQVTDGTAVAPNCVYVIPPNADMSILRGTLYLFEPSLPRGQRLPIDFFFRSLATDQRENSVGVVLSGMGTDGTLGVRALKEVAGLVLVQDPAAAKFDGMPRSAVSTGMVDIVAPAEELYTRLVSVLSHAPQAIPVHSETEAKDQNALEKIVILLRTHTGHDFALYKKSTLYRRVERRMGLHQINKTDHYVHFLQENPQERDLLFKELLIGVTSFFRDLSAWDQLKKDVIPALFADRAQGTQLRAWVAGCSTGEEAYSLAMVFKEALAEIGSEQRFSLQIFATDLDRDAIDKARAGVYPANIAADVSPERLRRFFVIEEGGSYRISQEIREMVTLAPQNLTMDPPFTKLDILICRNVLIYFTAELQKRLLSMFHYSLKPGGYLFLGSAETVGNDFGMFATLDGKSRLYQSKTVLARAEFAPFTPPFFPVPRREAAEGTTARPAPNLQGLADQVILQRFAPAAVMVNDKGDIVYVNGRTGKYLEPTAGKANWNVLAMARDGLRHPLATAFRQALASPSAEPVAVHSVKVKTNGDYQAINLTVQLLREPAALHGLLIVVFTDVAILPEIKQDMTTAGPLAGSDHIARLEEELHHLQGELQTTREEMQSMNEELKSSNEELQSTNEELQSTNEELTTSKEEMQSMNEELQTVNAELRSKLEELSRANNDMKNLLNSTEIATLFLDEALFVRRFTTQASGLLKLIQGDVGRPITDLASGLLYPTFAADVAEVLHTLIPIEQQLAADDGRWFMVRIMPYRTLENRIDGVAVTFVNITSFKLLEAELRQKHDELTALQAKVKTN